VRARGYVAGVYGASRNIGADMVPSVLTSPPDAIWGANWYGSCDRGSQTCPVTPSVWGMYQLPDTVYTNHQRIRQYWGDHTETWGGSTLTIDRDLADGPVAVGGGSPSTCPYTSLQTRVQPNASTPWTQTLTITLGAAFTVGTFQNGTGTLTSCCTSITVTGPNGFLASPANLGSITPPAAGTYTVSATCGSLTQAATVTVNPAASCPYSTIQTRVQPNASTPWTQTLTINQGQSFTVGSFYNGTGQLTTCCTAISVTGPNGYAVTPANLGVITPPTAGTYTVRATCGAVTETATVTVVGTSCPFTSIQTRVQPNASTPWTQTLTITQGGSFTVGSFKNGWGVLTDCCTTISVTGPNGYSASPANLGVVTPPASGTYTVRAVCGSLAENATVTVNPGTFVAIPLTNPGMETTTTAQFGGITGWGPNGGWAFHSGFPRPGNATLGTKFGFYSAGTTETFGQVLTTRYQAGKTYWFRSYAQGGGDNTGVLPYQLGYAATDGVLSSFTPLATTMATVGTNWVLTNGVTYIAPASGSPVGKQIIVRFGSGANGGQSDIWFDNLELFVR
jgi:ribosome modulation factor